MNEYNNKAVSKERVTDIADAIQSKLQKVQEIVKGCGATMLVSIAIPFDGQPNRGGSTDTAILVGIGKGNMDEDDVMSGHEIAAEINQYVTQEGMLRKCLTSLLSGMMESGLEADDLADSLKKALKKNIIDKICEASGMSEDEAKRTLDQIENVVKNIKNRAQSDSDEDANEETPKNPSELRGKELDNYLDQLLNGLKGEEGDE